MSVHLELHVPGAAATRYALDADRVTVGTSPAASIRVPLASGLHAEHLELMPSERGIQVQVPSGVLGTFVFEGSEQRRVHVPFGADIFVRNIRLTFVKDNANRKQSPLLVLLVPAFVTLAGLGVYSSAPVDTSMSDIPAPSLFDNASSVLCPDAGPAVAVHTALDAERAATAKQQRAPFDLTDGMAAVPFWQLAQSCYLAAGNHAEAARVSRAGSDWTARLDEQYATLRLRLSEALQGAHAAEALLAVHELKSMFALRKPEPYQRWLEQLRQSLERQVAQLQP